MTESTIARWLTLSAQDTWNIVLLKMLFIAFMFWLVIKFIDIYRKVAAERVVRVVDYWILGRRLKVIMSTFSVLLHLIYLTMMLYVLIYLVNAMMGISIHVVLETPLYLVLGVVLALCLCGIQVGSDMRLRHQTSK